MSNEMTTLLFDLDGTLVRMKRRGLELRFMLRAFRRFWSSIPPWRFRRAFWTAAEAMQANRTSRTNYAIFLDALSKHAKTGPADLDVRTRLFIEHDFPALADRFEPIPGAKETLVTARALGYRLILATNPVWPREAVLRRLEWGGIGEAAFDFITHSQVMTRCKPSPDYYAELLRLIGADARECLMVGNDARKDRPAQQVGITTFILGEDGTWDDVRSRIESIGVLS